ncbi:MAG: RNA polymerase sigma factor [Smithella sp.]
MDEHQAINLLRNGDSSGMEVLVNQYYLQAVRSSFIIVQDQSMAEDIVQDAFIKVMNKIYQLKSDRFKPWFFKIIINDSIRGAIKQKRIVPLDDHEYEITRNLAEWLIDKNPSVEEQFETKELHLQIIKALGFLTPQQRAIIVLRYYLEYSEFELEYELKIPRSTIKWRLYSAREKLRELLH